ncbi:glycogen synthase GlgA [Thiobacillus sedimenti]|uniref:Glycogen synthase n=1 Tax=Thiobacillus sedimenti TaxID=3110231 RepID=A0ABZ1CGT3_9PROT|nr:glycogen synthase GlgA [Thiobacillus sp. SCUT-2]WRS38580.1 glycogen synthase GlgA [Thiobacillus sp. SCUT-2]
MKRGAKKILFVASEAYPLVKTGGLGDVVYSLPHALKARGADIRLVLPGYRALLRQLDAVRILGWLDVRGADGMVSARVLETRHPEYAFPLWIVDCPALFDRPGNPYVDADGRDWPDNAERYAVFARVAALLAQDALELGWQPAVVHAHDWQTGLVAAFLADQPGRPRTVFTIHNLAYGGYFPHGDFVRLQLPGHWWSPEGVEFHGGLSMLKAGIVYADAVTTVSPTYAEEICTPPFGYGLDGLLLSRRYKLHGILNGIDTRLWDPARDPHLPAHYSAGRILPGKRRNKQALLEQLGAHVDDAMLQAPLLGLVGRLVEQKGIDWVLAAIPVLLAESDARFVLLGSGQAAYEQKLARLARQHPDRVFVAIGYDEPLAHRIEAGADLFLMPSRFEPCGLNQMYSLRYGTPPVVYRTGGLADTVVDADEAALAEGKATGFVFDLPEADAFLAAIRRALSLYREPARWRQLQQTGMRQSFDWSVSADHYLALYSQ